MGKRSLPYSISTDAPWLTIQELKSEVGSDRLYAVTVQWKDAPKTPEVGHVVVSDGKAVSVTIAAPLPDRTLDPPPGFHGFLESRGYVSIEPQHFSSKVDSKGASWEEIPDYGRTGGAMSIFPVTAPTEELTRSSPHLDYQLFSPRSGTVSVETVLSPSLDFQPQRGRHVGISFDDEVPQIVNTPPQYLSPAWQEAVKTNSRPIFTLHSLKPGVHTLKIWMIDPGIVVQNILIAYTPLPTSYLGPPESYRAKP
jgi:hypothetical protein